MSVDAIEAWAQHLNLGVIEVFRGDSSHIPLSRSVILHGNEYRDHGTFGQSSAALQKPLA
jgi:hypothetical protein